MRTQRGRTLRALEFEVKSRADPPAGFVLGSREFNSSATHFFFFYKNHRFYLQIKQKYRKESRKNINKKWKTRKSFRIEKKPGST